MAYDDQALAGAYDYIVIGAGSAGCVVARRLIEASDATVLLIEAGGLGEGVESLRHPPRWVENFDAPHDWAYRYAPSAHVAGRAVPLARGKSPADRAGQRADLGPRPSRRFRWLGRRRRRGMELRVRPAVLPQERGLEDGASAVRGVGGPIHVERARDLHPVASALIDAGRSYGMPYLDDINVAAPEGAGPINTNVRDGARSSSWEGYVAPILDHPRLTVLTGALVTRLAFEGCACSGVELLRGGRSQSVRATQEVVLSAGSIDTPRLLMLSGVGDADELQALGIRPRVDLRGVGKNLQDHIIVAGLCFEPRTALPPPNNNLEGSTFFWRSRQSLASPDLMFVALQIPLVTPEIAEVHSVPQNGFCIAPGLMRIKSRGHLRLLSDQPSGPLEIQPNMLSDPEDVEALAAAIELGFDIADQPAYRDLIGRWAAPPRHLPKSGRLEFLRRAAMSYSHPVGTCAMGRGPEAVVDPQLRVRGVERLRVVDASVMPAITSANTNAPTVMIAERAADLLLNRLIVQDATYVVV